MDTALIILGILVALAAGVIIGPLMIIVGVIALVVAAVGALAVESVQFSFSSSLHLIAAGAVLFFISSLFWAVSAWALERLATIPEAVAKWVRYLFVGTVVGIVVVCAGFFLYTGLYIGAGAVLLFTSPFLRKDVRKKAREVMEWGNWLFIGFIVVFVVIYLELYLSVEILKWRLSG